mmetsp:Transcript_8875/g.26914  ORF Transcript_8875/g.26914 Transcript_8875/m.26914 type:complete len:97 (+) Transcript_8875:223-513(+)
MIKKRWRWRGSCKSVMMWVSTGARLLFVRIYSHSWRMRSGGGTSAVLGLGEPRCCDVVQAPSLLFVVPLVPTSLSLHEVLIRGPAMQAVMHMSGSF